MKDKRRYVRNLLLILTIIALFTGCRVDHKESKETHSKTTTETTEIIIEESKLEENITEENPGTIKISAKEREIIGVELNDPSFAVNDDIRFYIETSKEELYDTFTISHNVDVTTPGEYQITVQNEEWEFKFPVEVKDTLFPSIEIVADYIVAKNGEKIHSDFLIVKAEDNDPEYRFGLVGFDKVIELEDFNYYNMEMTSPVYEQEYIDYTIDLMDTLTFPKEEGVYKSKAVVVDKSGNAGTATMYFVVDNTGPTITIAKTHVILYPGEGYDFASGLDCSDNFFPRGECTVWVDEESYKNMASFLQSGKRGDTSLTYIAEDGIGNLSKLTIKVTAKAESASGGVGNSSSENNKQAYFDEAMAREAFNKVNEYRETHGVPRLAWDDNLYEAAKIRAKEIAVSFSHTRLDGSNFNTVFDSTGVHPTKTASENAAWGDTSGQAVATGWYNSSGHKENMLKDNYDYMAVACWWENGIYYWINLFYR